MRLTVVAALAIGAVVSFAGDKPVTAEKRALGTTHSVTREKFQPIEIDDISQPCQSVSLMNLCESFSLRARFYVAACQAADTFRRR